MRVNRKLIFDKEARRQLKAGVDIVAKAVGSTLGPKGRNVIYEREYGVPVVTKDGVTVAREIVLEDDYQNIGASLIKEAAIKCNDVAGDGTTTATVLAAKLLEGAFEAIEQGANPMELSRQLQDELKKLLDALPAYKIEITDDKMIEQVATISANNDPIMGKAITDAIKEVGKDGVVTVEEKYGMGVDMEIQKGFQINSGLVSPWMITDPKRMEASLGDVPVVCVQFKVTSLGDVAPLITYFVRKNIKDFVLVAPEIGMEALNILVEGRKAGEFNCVGIKAPYVQDRQLDIIQDIAIYCGGQLLTANQSMGDLSEAHVGQVKRIIASKKATTFVDGSGSPEAILERVESIKSMFASVDDEFDLSKLKERVSKLQGAVAVLKVGAMNEIEMKNTKYRVEDAINATQAALEEGVVIGGGMTFKKLDLDTMASDMVSKSLCSIFEKILENAGIEHTGWDLSGENMGYNALTNKVEDLLQAGVLDPYKVVRTALESAFSVAIQIISSDTVVAFCDDPAKARML